MKFWDSSALVPLLVDEALTAALKDLAVSEDAILAWWASEVECASAVARLEREGKLSPEAATQAFARIEAFCRSWQVIEPVEKVRQTAK
ncbi:MAG: type II toxin-antitoxin system VapC family toxin, partial [bacterium]|nr:type II toxin-antitoxin system VapC family toxin [bacterium]